ncbi:hypothetical protein GQX73_g9588 [Xylaria multiplex]|uniref:T cell CD4 receptor C-terminal region domain-containing protein n=1 Tax=Xylaria multiplex TaxID=323545 RepID=A0A7C8MGH4_9PEZI|nr:hypothetical protein GQX73_g9588 [Xylaria multiplex]
MRASFRQRSRRVPRVRLSVRADEELKAGEPAGDVPVGADPPSDELSGDETSDDEFSDGESSDDDEEEEEDEDEGQVKVPAPPPPPKDAPSSTSLGPGNPTASASSRSTAITPPATTLLTTTSQPAKETATSSSQPLVSDSSSASLPTASSALTSSQSIPVMSTSAQQSPSSSLVSSSVTSITSTSPIPVLIPGTSITSTSGLSQSTSDGQLVSPTNIPQADNSISAPEESGSSTSSNSQRAGQIAGGTIGGIAFIGLIIFAIWMWRRRRNQADRLSRMSDDMQYYAAPAQAVGKSRSPSSIMNQLMTAAYAAEDGGNYRNSEQNFDGYANEKQRFTAHEGESTERLTPPAAAQLRPPSIAARTETTNRTESTWKTWGVLAGSSRVSAPRNWWVDRYLRA